MSAYANDPRVEVTGDESGVFYKSATRPETWCVWRDSVTGEWVGKHLVAETMTDFYDSADKAIRELIGDPR